MGLRETLEAATRPNPHGSTDEQIAWVRDRMALNVLAPELASLALDMGEALRAVAWKDSAGLCWCPGETEFAVAHPNADHTPRCQVANALLARLDQLGKEQT